MGRIRRGMLILVLLSPFRALPRLTMASLGVSLSSSSPRPRGSSRTSPRWPTAGAGPGWGQPRVRRVAPVTRTPLFGMGLNNFCVQYGTSCIRRSLVRRRVRRRWPRRVLRARGLSRAEGVKWLEALRQTDAAFGLGLLAATSSISALAGIEAGLPAVALGTAQHGHRRGAAAPGTGEGRVHRSCPPTHRPTGRRRSGDASASTSTTSAPARLRAARVCRGALPEATLAARARGEAFPTVPTGSWCAPRAAERLSASSAAASPTRSRSSR